MIICRARGLEKRYAYYPDPKGRLKEWISLGHRCLHEEIVALRGVDLEITSGTCVGIIGSNGAGKSTLLRILAGLTPPSAGSYEIRGSVFPLMDIGAGFHPEFSGLDNARFNAELLRIPRKERVKRLDEIVEFSELGSAIHRPLKTYSTGMMLRLGFSVALHVRPDILLVDEILAVGDEHFFAKCIDAMDRFIERGGTLLLCSHDLSQIRRICGRVLWIDGGRVRQEGPAMEVTEEYNRFMIQRDSEEVKQSQEAVGRPRNWPRITRVWLTDRGGNETTAVETGDLMSVHIEYETPDPGLVFNIGVRIDRYGTQFCFGSSANHEGITVPRIGHAIFRLPCVPLLTGDYSVSVYLVDDLSVVAYHQEVNVVRFNVRHEGRETGLFKADDSWEFGSPPQHSPPGAVCSRPDVGG